MPEIVHACDCGRKYTAMEWDALRLVGLQCSARGPEYELRLCASCGSSRSIRVADSPWATALLTAVICLCSVAMAWIALALLTGAR